MIVIVKVSKSSNVLSNMLTLNVVVLKITGCFLAIEVTFCSNQKVCLIGTGRYF